MVQAAVELSYNILADTLFYFYNRYERAFFEKRNKTLKQKKNLKRKRKSKTKKMIRLRLNRSPVR